MIYSHFFLLFIALIEKVIADVSISKPTAGQTFTVSGDSVTVPVSWIESQGAPKLTDIQSYSFTICTGPNSKINGIKTLDKVSSSDITGYSYDLTIPADIGTSGNYFIQIYAVTSDGGYTIHYSNRFLLEGLTGSIVASGSDPNPPSAEVHIDDGSTTTMSPQELSQSFQLYYTSQTGKTRYAPMQTQPGSKVTASTWSRRFPTSSVTYYSTLENSLSQVSTVTPGWSYTISSAINWATPAANPSDNGGWYDPKSKIKSPTLSSLTSGKDSSSLVRASSSASST